MSYDIVCFLYILRILLRILNQGRLFELQFYGVDSVLLC